MADFIRAKGRVAISELAQRSNDFIDLEAKQVLMPSPETLGLDLDLDGVLEAPPSKAVAVGA